MSIPSVFSFENAQVRALGTPDLPLFVAVDAAGALGYKDKTNAIKQHVDPEDIIKSEIETNGGRQTVNCVNESGLYALIFGSKLESAKRFKRWVTSEVLPAIRKTGRYEAHTTLTTEELYEIRKAVKSRAKNCSIHYQTIYNALYDYFQVASYKDLTQQQFQPALTFIQTCDLKPQLPGPAIPEGAIIFEKNDAERIRNFVYYMRYLFRPQLDAFEQFLKAVDSPMASKFWDLIHETNFDTIELSLNRHGYSVKDLPCYKSLTSKKA